MLTRCSVIINVGYTEITPAGIEFVVVDWYVKHMIVCLSLRTSVYANVLQFRRNVFVHSAHAGGSLVRIFLASRDGRID